MAYTAAPGDVEMGREERAVVLVEKKSITRLAYTVSGGLLLVALCVACARIFTWYSNSRLEMEAQSGQTTALNMAETAEKTDQLNYTLSQNSSEDKAAIHLASLEWRDNQSEVVWGNDIGLAFTQGGFKLVNNRIVIPQAGLYFVYSQASFRVYCSEEKLFTPLSYKILVITDYYNKAVPLMSAVRSACQNAAQEDSYGDGQGWYNAIYLGAVFQLNRGDRLWTETNQLSELENDEGRTFFGVFAL